MTSCNKNLIDSKDFLINAKKTILCSTQLPKQSPLFNSASALLTEHFNI